MKQKLIKANTQLREAFIMARANRVELKLANQLKQAILATEQSLFTLRQLEDEGFHAN